MAFQNPLDSDIANDPQCATWNPTSVQCVCGKWIPLRPSPSSRLEPWEVHKTLCPLPTFNASMGSRRPPTPWQSSSGSLQSHHQASRPSSDHTDKKQVSGNTPRKIPSSHGARWPSTSSIPTGTATAQVNSQDETRSPGPSTRRSRKEKEYMWSSGTSSDTLDSVEPSRIPETLRRYDDARQDISHRTEPMDVDVGLSRRTIHSSPQSRPHWHSDSEFSRLSQDWGAQAMAMEAERKGWITGASTNGNTSGTPIVLDENSGASAWISDSYNNPLDVRTSVQRPKITKQCAQRGFSPDNSDLQKLTPRPPIYFRPQYPSFFPDSHQEPLNKLTPRIRVQWFQQGVRETMDRQEAGYPDLVGAYLNAPVSYADDSANPIAHDNQTEIVAASAYEDPAIASRYRRILYPNTPQIFRKGGCSRWTNRNIAHWMLSLEEDWQCRNWSESEVICAFCEEKIPVGAGCRPKLAFWDAHKLTCSMEWPHDLATRPYDSLSENDRKLLALLKRSRSNMKKNGGGNISFGVAKPYLQKIDLAGSTRPGHLLVWMVSLELDTQCTRWTVDEATCGYCHKSVTIARKSRKGYEDRLLLWRDHKLNCVPPHSSA